MDHDCTFQTELERSLFSHKAGEIAPNNLPYFPCPFVGRNRDVSNIIDLFSNHSLVNIYGLPAVGKSTLAIHVGYEMASCGVAVRYINVDDTHVFKSYDESEPSDSTTTEHHDQKPTQGLAISKPFTDIILPWYSHTEKRFVSTTARGLIEWAKGLSNSMLLILDNCDSLLQGMERGKNDSISVLDALSKASPYLHTVTTSRQKVQLLDAKSYKLKPLDNESAIELLQFVSPSMTQIDRSTINNLLDGIPLALKIVGSLSETSPPQLIIRKLQQSLTGTLTPDGVRPDTEKMRPVLRLSFNYLDNGTQECALYLSHFPGSFSEEAALHILSKCTNSTSGPAECLQKLSDMSLLDEYFYAGQSRYQFHRLIKDYLTDVETCTSPLSVKAVRFNSSFFLHYIQTLCNFVDIYNQLPYNEENIGRFEYESHNFEYLLEVAKVHYFSISTTIDLIYALKCDLMLEIFTTQELLKVGQRILMIFEDRMDNISTKIGAFETLKHYFNLQAMLKKWLQCSRNCEVLCEETFPQQRRATRVDIIDRQLSLVNYSAYIYYQRLSFPFKGIGESICVSYCWTQKDGSLMALLIWLLCIVVFIASTKTTKWKTVLVVTIFLFFIYWIGIIYSVSTLIHSVYIAIFVGLVMIKHENLRVVIVVQLCTVLCVLLICAFRKTSVSVAHNYFIGIVTSHLVYRKYPTFGAGLLYFATLKFLLETDLLFRFT